MANEIILTKEDLERIAELRIRKVMAGGTVKYCKKDTASNRIYYCNENGELTGVADLIPEPKSGAKSSPDPVSGAVESVHPAIPDPHSKDFRSKRNGKKEKQARLLEKQQRKEDILTAKNKVVQAKAQLKAIKRKRFTEDQEDSELISALAAFGEAAQENIPKKSKKPMSKEKKKKIRALVFVFVLISFLILLAVFFGKAALEKISGFIRNPNELFSRESAVSAAVEPEAMPAEIAEEIPENLPEEENTVSVLVASCDILPDSLLSTDYFETADIAESEYLQSFSFGKTLLSMSEETAASINGSPCYSAEYIHEGQYLTEDMITGTKNIYDNPWVSGSRQYSFPLVSNGSQHFLDGIAIGQVCKLTIPCVISKEDAVPPPEDPEIDGLGWSCSETDSAYVITYTLNDYVICDCENASGESLYDLYLILASVPSTTLSEYIRSHIMEMGFQSRLSIERITITVKNEEIADYLGTLRNIQQVTAMPTGLSNYETPEKEAYLSAYTLVHDLLKENFHE